MHWLQRYRFRSIWNIPSSEGVFVRKANSTEDYSLLDGHTSGTCNGRPIDLLLDDVARLSFYACLEVGGCSDCFDGFIGAHLDRSGVLGRRSRWTSAVGGVVDRRTRRCIGNRHRLRCRVCARGN